MLRLLIPWLSRLFNASRLGRGSHARNVRASRRVLAKLATFDADARALGYLRKIDPYVFEELALSLLELRGAFVLRSARYSGDGGVDGSFWLPGHGWRAVQCKRYGKSITPAHARAFASICQTKFKGGLFVHTGRTGDSSEEALAGPGMWILSGSDLARCARDKLADPFALCQARRARLDARRAPAAPSATAAPAKPKPSRSKPPERR